MSRKDLRQQGNAHYEQKAWTAHLVKLDERTELKDRWHSGVCAGPFRTYGQRYVRVHMASCSKP